MYALTGVKFLLRGFVLVALLLVLGFVAAQFGTAADPRNDRPKRGASLETLAHPPEEVVSEREDKLEDMCIQAKARKMPLAPFLILHPQARPSDAEIETLCKWTASERAKSE